MQSRVPMLKGLSTKKPAFKVCCLFQEIVGGKLLLDLSRLKRNAEIKFVKYFFHETQSR